MRRISRSLFGKIEGKKHLGQHRCGGEDRSKLNLYETGWKNVVWFQAPTNTRKHLP
jgi:hypothetical protein